LSIEPAPLPGVRAARTMFAALFGELALHPRSDALAEFSQDAYSLFYGRSAAMGWLTSAVEGASGGFWGMNDAEAGPGSGPPPQRIAWFQVVLTGPVPGEMVAVQPFLACAGDVVARLGALRLDAVQILLPDRDAPADGQMASPSGMRVAWPLLDSVSWFADCDPRRRAPVRVTLDGWPDPSIRAAAPAIVRSVREISQDVFVCESFSLDENDHLVLRPNPLEFQLGAVHHRVTFRGTLAEWSLDALGWLAVFLADQSSRHGVSTPLMFTADQSGAPGPPAG
jgi:hypothetical protein